MESAETSKETEESKWRIPFNISYDSYLLILKALFQKKADAQEISLEELISVTGLNRSTLVGNAAFLRSVGVLQSNLKGYKLTSPLGAKYAKAVYTNDQQLVKEASRELIVTSHLNGLLDFMTVKPRKIEEIYNYIKGEGRFSSGAGIAGMSPPYAAGAKTLLRIFKDAGQLPDGIELDSKSKEPSGGSTKRKGVIERTRRNSVEQSTEETENYTSDDKNVNSFGKVMIRGIGVVEIKDNDTLRLAESFLKLLRKRMGLDETDTL